MENRLLAFNEAKEAPHPEAKLNKEKKTETKPIDGARVRDDVGEVLSKLSYLEHDVQEDVVKDFRAKLDAIRQKFQKLDETKVDALKELEKEMYKEFSPFLEKAAQSQLGKCKNIQKAAFEKKGMNFTFGGETMTAEMTDLYEVRSIQILGATMQFQKPVKLEDFDGRIGNNVLAAMRLIGKRFDTKGLAVTATEVRCEFTAKEDGKEKKFVATPQDVLEIKQVPTAEKMQEWGKASKELDVVRKRMDDDVRSLRDVFKGGDGMMAMEMMHMGKDMMRKMGIDTSKFTPEQKKSWDALLALQKELSTAEDKERALRSECGKRTLQAKDGAQVQEEGDPRWSSGFNWFYLDKEGKEQTRLGWSSARLTNKTESEKGVKVKETYFSDTGLPESEKDFRKGTTDRYDEKGRKSYRELFDPKKPETMMGTQMYNSEGKLMDEKALQSMTPTQIEAHFLPLSNKQEDYRIRYAAMESCYTAAKYIIKCPRGEEILRKLVLNEPRKAFEEFAKFKEAPYAVKLLEEAAYQIGSKDSVTRLVNDAAKITGLSDGDKKRIIDISERKKDNMPLAEKLVSGDSKPQPLGLLEDPGLRKWSEVKEEWIDWKKSKSPALDEEEEAIWKLQMRAMITRNLYFQNVDVTEASVKTEFLRIVETREKYAKLEVFKGRNVLHVAHAEVLRDLRDTKGKPYTDKEYKAWEESSEDVHLFGKKGNQDAIKAQQDGKGSYEIIRPKKKIEALQQAKKDMLEKIKTMAPPATFILDGHGGPDAWYLSDGTVAETAKTGKVTETDATVKISVEELAQALVERAKKFPKLKTEDPSGKDIFVFACCYNSNFIRSLYEQLGDAPKPIALGMSEYGQYGYSVIRSKYGSKLFSQVLELKNDRPTTISDVFKNEFKDFSNPSLYIPDDKNLPMQITKNERMREKKDDSQDT